MVEDLLEQHLNMLGITPEQFLEACDKGKNQGGVQRDVFKFLLAMEDFLSILFHQFIYAFSLQELDDKKK